MIITWRPVIHMVISFKILDAVQGKDVMSGLSLKSLGISLSFFGFYRQRLHWAIKLKKVKKKADEQVLYALILSWELVIAMSAKILFCWCKWGCGCRSLSKLAVLTGDIIVPKLLIVSLSPSTAFWMKIIMPPLLGHLGELKPETWVDWIHWPCWQKV